MSTISLHTSTDIARILNRKVDQVRHILNTRPIKPVQRGGIARLYGEDAIEQVRVELAGLDAKRKATH